MAASARIAIVGGGLAGLSAAMRLKKAGARVEIFERSRLLGGRATSFEVDGRVVDNGQHVYLACCDAFEEFVAECGMADALYLQDRFDVRVFSKDGTQSRLRAAALPPPLHLLASFVSYRYLSVSSKFQIASALVALKLRPAGATHGESFASWLSRHGQSPQTVRAFWEPFLVPALNAPLNRMSAAEAAFVLSTAFLHDADAARFGYAKVPLASIMERAAAQADAVHRATAVLAIEHRGGGVVLRLPDGEASFDAVVVAVSPRALAKMLPADVAAALPPLDVYERFAIMDVHLWYDGVPLDCNFAAILDSPVQWVFQKAPGYLCCSISAADEFVARPSAEMAQLAWREVQTAIPVLAQARLVRGAATRNPEGTYLAAAGARRPSAPTAVPNIALAGAWTATGWPDTMESAVRSGWAAADVLLKSDFAMRESAIA